MNLAIRTGCLLVLISGVVTPVFAEGLQDLVLTHKMPLKVVGDCQFTEGPAYSPKGFLLFSDIPNSRIVRLNNDGSSADFLKPSGPGALNPPLIYAPLGLINEKSKITLVPQYSSNALSVRIYDDIKIPNASAHPSIESGIVNTFCSVVRLFNLGIFLICCV